MNLEELRKKANELDEQEKFKEVIELLSDEILEQYKDAELYATLARAIFRVSGDDDKILNLAQKAIELKPDYVFAYNIRGIAWTSKNQYDRAIADFDKVIELQPDSVAAYNNRGITWKSKAEYDKAIADYNIAIELKPDYADAYYNRGTARRDSGKNLEQSVKDFEEYLNLAVEKDDVWAKRAKDIIEELWEKIRDAELNEIIELISEIKKLLLISEGCVTHYTGLTVTKLLICDKKSKFRISEGAFLNDTSEGTEFFKFLDYQFSKVREDGLLAKTFAPKPFIGSFVTENKHDDLNLWRFYGKEGGVEAKGCALTLRIKEFLDAITQSITKDIQNPGKSSDDDINFYRVAYWDHDKTTTNFQIPNTNKEAEMALNTLMIKIKEKVNKYHTKDKSILEKHLNSIAFLFKSDAYKNENEIRLVIKGIEFEKQFDESPRVYIELINLRPLIEQITLGPKVEKPDEWAAVFHYSFEKETDENKKPKKILISRLPYK